MATTITDFMQSAGTRQFARDFLFRVEQINIEGAFFGEELIYAKSAVLPGRNIENKTVNYAGQQFNVPGKSSYPGSESYTIDFYHDESVDLRSKFEAASRSVFDNESTKGDIRMPGTEAKITLKVLDRKLKEAETITLIGASIRDIGPITYNIADGTGDVLTFPVTFAYHYYENFAPKK